MLGAAVLCARHRVLNKASVSLSTLAGRRRLCRLCVQLGRQRLPWAPPQAVESSLLSLSALCKTDSPPDTCAIRWARHFHLQLLLEARRSQAAAFAQTQADQPWVPMLCRLPCLRGCPPATSAQWCHPSAMPAAPRALCGTCCWLACWPPTRPRALVQPLPWKASLGCPSLELLRKQMPCCRLCHPCPLQPPRWAAVLYTLHSGKDWACVLAVCANPARDAQLLSWVCCMRPSACPHAARNSMVEDGAGIGLVQAAVMPLLLRTAFAVILKRCLSSATDCM